MAELVVRSHRRNRTGFRVFVSDGRVLKTVDNPHFPRGETPDNPLRPVEADALTESRWGFELDEIGDGKFVEEPDPDEPGSVQRRFEGVMVGYNWRARDAVWRDRMNVTRVDRGELKDERLARNRLEGQVRYPPAQRGDPSDVRLVVEKRSLRPTDVRRG